MLPYSPRLKRCKEPSCGESFMAVRRLQAVCGWECGLKVGASKTAKKLAKAAQADKRATKAKLEAMKPRSKWMQEAQKEFNAWIRARDADKPCVSCGRHHTGQWHAGHYLSVGARPELRFDEQNVQKQCQPCNTHLHGNLVAFRAELSLRIGQTALDRIEGPHEPKKYTIDELKSIRNDYRQRLKEMG